MKKALGSFLFLFALTAFGQSNWSGLQTSPSSLARAGTGVTQPIALQLPDWSRGHVADASFIANNPALVATLADYRARFSPAVLQTRASNLYSGIDAWSTPWLDTAALRSSLAGRLGEQHGADFDVGLRWFEKEVGLSVFYSRTTRSSLDSDGTLEFQRHRDLSVQFVSGTTLFSRPDFGQLDFGTGLKAIYRNGDEFVQLIDAAVASLSDSNLKKSAFAAGLDYGLQYTLPSIWILAPWRVQLGLAWKDVGTTPFFLGKKASTGRRFEPLPNNQVAGLGVGLPNILGGVRSAVRVEYSEWARDIPWTQKLAYGAELRLPVIATINLGLVATRFSGGVTFRFPNLEAEVATTSQSWGEGLARREFRSIVMELRSVF